MSLTKVLAAAVVGAALLVSNGVRAQDGRFSGEVFGDYYYVAANHRPDIEDMNGLWFRRVYLTYDRSLSESFSTRLRLEMAHPGDFSSASNAEPFVKDAHLIWKKGRTEVLLGISPTPTWGHLVEKTWGYRAVEKTPLDLHKFGSSRDFGVALKGKVDEGGIVRFHLMAGNGSSTKSETNKGKIAMAAVSLHPAEGVVFEIYGDYNAVPGDNDKMTVHAFLAYDHDVARFGLLLAHQTRNVENANAVDLQLGSAYTAVKVHDQVRLFARVDRMFDPNPDGEGNAYIPFAATVEYTFLLGGLDFTPIDAVHLMPNVEVVVYDENDAGIAPDRDVIPRLTFFYTF